MLEPQLQITRGYDQNSSLYLSLFLGDTKYVLFKWLVQRICSTTQNGSIFEDVAA